MIEVAGWWLRFEMPGMQSGMPKVAMGGKEKPAAGRPGRVGKGIGRVEIRDWGRGCSWRVLLRPGWEHCGFRG